MESLTNLNFDTFHNSQISFYETVIQQIQNAIPGWEESVPERVAELIKLNYLLNFPVGSNSQNKIQ